MTELEGAADPRSASGWSAELPLVGSGGEPVQFRRTVLSHGVASLPPVQAAEDGSSFAVTLRLAEHRARVVDVGPGDDASSHVSISVRGHAPGRADRAEIVRAVRHILALDEDLSEFYDLCATDPALDWIPAGAGRMMRCATVFENVVKTICTTNCAWSATVRMVDALVQHLGVAAPGAPVQGAFARTFPSPFAMAEAGEDFYRDIVRAGYRGSYLISIARSVAEGAVDLEELGRASREDVPDDEVAARLQALPGVGPYAAAHIMLMLGRYSRLILDSWTRPTFLRMSGARRAKDSTIVRRFRRYGPYAGLAFWLYLTRDWVETPEPLGPAAGEWPRRAGE